MDNEKLLKRAAQRNELIGYIIKVQLDSEKADQDVILPQDVIDKKQVDRARLKNIKNLIVELYSIIDKVEDDTKRCIQRLQLLIDESYL